MVDKSMVNKKAICQVEMYMDAPCGRLVYDSKGKCICHSERKDKDVTLFQSEIDKIFEINQAVSLDFTRFTFPKGGWSFVNKRFEKVAQFLSSQFLGEAQFRAAKFSGDANFYDAKFSGDVDFDDAKFSGYADFTDAKFSGKAHFTYAKFSDGAQFTFAKFSGKARFSYSRFSGKSLFYKVQFSGEAEFEDVQFLGAANFRLARFVNKAIFSRAEFSFGVDFSEAHFSDRADYYGVQFSGKSDFESTSFDVYISFTSSIAREGARLTFDVGVLDENLIWKGGASFRSFRIEKGAEVTFRKVNMRGAVLLESSIRNMTFIDVEWPRTNRWHKRRTVADEMIDDEKDYTLIAQLYQ
ncbi:MAG: pentapeptide repeat-containing protein, partial [candidate division Zixibacteria bacterium]|nr:pentapeptide repeat-containing protein [candidate division Zixibacteria bacterium]